MRLARTRTTLPNVRALAANDPQREGDGDAATGSLMRGIEVLAAFRSGGGHLSNAEIATATNLPRATVSRLTKDLLRAGFLDYDADTKRYELRPRVLTLGFAMLSNLAILPVAHEQMQRLAEDLACTVSLVAPDGTEMIYLDRCSGGTLPYFFSTGSAIETARTAAGKAYIAALPESRRHELLEQLASRYGPSWEGIKKEIDQAIGGVASRGFCTVDETWRIGIRSVAAPFISKDRRKIFAISCVTSTHDTGIDELESRHGPAIVNLTRELGRFF